MAKAKYAEWLTGDGLTLLAAWARDGLTDEQIAKRCGVNVKTLYDWKNKYDPICNALKKGKEVVDIEVENALLKRARGFEYDEVKVDESDDGYKRTVTRKYVPPDVGAAAFWLKNRKGDFWRDRREPAAEGSGELIKLIEGLRDGQ